MSALLDKGGYAFESRDFRNLIDGGSQATNRPVSGLQLRGAAFGDGDMELLQHFPELVELQLTGTSITSQGIQRLRTLRNLKYLDLSASNGISDDAMVHLKCLSNLHSLYLDGTRVSDESTSEIGGMQGLRHLGISETGITAAGAKQIKEFLPKTNISPFELFVSHELLNVLEEIRGLGGDVIIDRDLQLAQVSYRKNADVGIKILVDHLDLTFRLERLSLAHSDVTREGLMFLSELRFLKEIDLRSTGITAEETRRISRGTSANVLWSSTRHTSNSK